MIVEAGRAEARARSGGPLWGAHGGGEEMGVSAENLAS